MRTINIQQMRFVVTLCVVATAISGQWLHAASEHIGPLAKMPDKDTAPLTKDANRRTQEFFDTMFNSARTSIEVGMPALAQSITEDALKYGPPNPSADRLKMVCVDAMIAQGNYETAKNLMSELIDNSELPENKIRKALIEVGLNNPQKAEVILNEINPASLNDENFVWYEIARGYSLYQQDKPDLALKEFEKAMGKNKNQYVATDIEIAVNVCRLSENFEEKNLPQLSEDLGRKVSLYLGTPSGFQFAKQYAAALFRLGKPEEAVEVLDQQLQVELAPEIDKDEIKLISATMINDPLRQYQLLSDILKGTSSRNIIEFALSLLSRNPNTSVRDTANLLNDVLENGSPKIRDRILLEMSKFAVKRRNAREASSFSDRLIKEFPESKYRKDALRILAWAAFSSYKDKSPEYRLAATYLTELAEIEETPLRAEQMKLLAADCYYLNKDYVTAAKIYDELFSSVGDNRGLLLNRAIDSYLTQGDISSALTMADKAYSLGGVADDDVWNAEWKIISKYRQNGNIRKALERINRAIASTGKASELLRIRMLWLRAKMTEESREYLKTTELTDNILAEIDGSNLKDKETLDIIGSNTMLMKARSLEMLSKLDGSDGAFENYEKLRRKYPKSEAAMLSYLNQARDEATLGRFVKAQQLCLELAKLRPRSNYAYSALFDSALYARQIGSESNYKAALASLDKLCQDFPDDNRNFYVRLAQAEILRTLNDFADARKLYNDIINKYSTHPEINLAWLGLADSILAQRDKETNAAAIYERLYSLPEIPTSAKAEAAFKWAFALEKAGKMREANEVWWITSSHLLSDQNVGVSGKYWIGRSLYSLAKSLEALGMVRDARAAYELISKYKLPAASLVKEKFSNKDVK